jgi:signal peptidase I
MFNKIFKSKKKQDETERPGFLKGALSFLNLIIMILAIRWIIFEVFMIPSGSMYPKLYINDYVFVTKMDFGVRVPFIYKWVYGPVLPERRAITVFKDPDDSKYLIKRLVGLPNDKLMIFNDFILSLNGEKVTHKQLSDEEHSEMALRMKQGEDTFTGFYETFPGQEPHIILTFPGEENPDDVEPDELAENSESFEVPEDYLLFMGDNRHMSYDGRRFGYVSAERLVGRARFIILSCDQKLVMGAGCSPLSLRLNRLGNGLNF